jgi:hypothetical protein
MPAIRLFATCPKPVLLVLIALCGCGGGMVKTPDPSPVVTPPPPLPSAWTVTDLPPLAGADAAQTNAVNVLGTAVGYSVTAGVPTATLWQNGVPSELWPGVRM